MEGIVEGIFGLFLLAFQTIMPKGRHAAHGLILLLVLGASMAALIWGQTALFYWWNVAALWWWGVAMSSTGALVISVVIMVGCVLGAWIDFMHLDPRQAGFWPFFYLFTGCCWGALLVWLSMIWPDDHSTGFRFTFAFLLYAVVGNFYATVTIFLRKMTMGGGGSLRDVAAQQSHGKARAASEPEAIAAVGKAPPKPKRRQFED